jgi:hypothetical protein
LSLWDFKDQNELVNFIDSKNRWVPKRAEVVIFACPIPDDYVVKFKPDFSHELNDIHVKRVKLRLLAQIHHIHNAIRSGLKHNKCLGKHLL